MHQNIVQYKVNGPALKLNLYTKYSHFAHEYDVNLRVTKTKKYCWIFRGVYPDAWTVFNMKAQSVANFDRL